jgi:molybdopterin molybdotransferase
VALVALPSALRKYADGHHIVPVEGATVAQALHAAAVAHPDLQIRLFDEAGRLHPHLVVFHNDAQVARDELESAVIGPEDRVDVMIAIVGGAEDVRMRGFRDRADVEAALAAATEDIEPLPAEPVAAADAIGRVLANPVVSEVHVPPFRRATMDGYAVQAEATYGASPYHPAVLEIIGESMPGTTPPDLTGPTAACRIMTGAPVPQHADAVVRAEDATERGDQVQIAAPVAGGRNVGRIGEDIAIGTEVLASGRRLLPQDVGLLASIGHDPVEVHRRPVVRIIVSGDELLTPGERPGGTSIVDSNSPMLAALVVRDGGIPEVVRLPDDREQMRAALSEPGADVIVTAGAASVGTEDNVPYLVAELGELTIHGVAMRPSSPTGVGRIGPAPVLLLPGNPVSCLVAYDFFAGPVIRILGGRPPQWPYRTIRLPLRKRIVSQIGRTDYARVTIVDGGVESLAVSGASVLSSVTRAAGFVVIPAGLEGYPEGAEVDVHLYDDQAAL